MCTTTLACTVIEAISKSVKITKAVKSLCSRIKYWKPLSLYWNGIKIFTRPSPEVGTCWWWSHESRHHLFGTKMDIILSTLESKNCVYNNLIYKTMSILNEMYYYTHIHIWHGYGLLASFLLTTGGKHSHALQILSSVCHSHPGVVLPLLTQYHAPKMQLKCVQNYSYIRQTSDIFQMTAVLFSSFQS